MPEVRTGDQEVTSQTLLWTPRAKGRPRTTFVKGGYRTYTPHETVEAEAALRAQWIGTPAEGPIILDLMLSDTDVTVTISPCPPVSSHKLQRGDLDNYVKLIADSLIGRAYVDDRQIRQLHAVIA